MKLLLIRLLAASWLIQSGYSAEMRVWMSRKGGTLDAELAGVHGDMVSLTNKDSKEIKGKGEGGSPGRGVTVSSAPADTENQFPSASSAIN